MQTFLVAMAIGFAVVAGLSGALSIVGRLGAAGRALAAACSRAPLLDVVVSLFTWIPWVACGVVFGWRGILGALCGQIVGLFAWVFTHELADRRATRGPRIVKFLNRVVGRGRNHAALWVTSVALPGFLLIRLIEIACYPFLIWLLDFPRYKQSEWVNVSRQKFDGLVGHDLIWCLYCDWMTGVYALGAEMLRNVESFWCPIRFYDGKKCDNCKLDFPDVTGGWVPATATMADVEQTLQQHYGAGNHSWFGHPTRLTVRGEPVVAQGGAPGVHVPPAETESR